MEGFTDLNAILHTGAANYFQWKLIFIDGCSYVNHQTF